jgi:tetratricopeptide (TPR) repeat protein
MMGANLTTSVSVTTSGVEASDFEKGNLLFRSGDYEAATMNYSASIALRPHFFPAWTNYIRCLIHLRKANDLVTAVDRYLDLYGDQLKRIRDIQILTTNHFKSDVSSLILRKSRIDPWIRHVLHQIDGVDGSARQKRLHDLFDADPSLFITCHLLGDSYFGAQKFSEASKWYQAALSRNPNYGWSWFNLAKTLIANNANFLERLNALERAAELMSDSMHLALVLRPLAAHLSCTRFIERAAHVYVQIADIEPTGDAVLFAIETLLKIGDTQHACRLAERLEDWPNLKHHAWAADFLEWANQMRNQTQEKIGCHKTNQLNRREFYGITS